MAVETVTDTHTKREYNDAREALRHTGQAMAILRAVWLAVEAQEDGAVIYADNTFSRWGPAVDAACKRVQAARDFSLNGIRLDDAVDWWTPVSLTEALGAAIWRQATGSGDSEFEAEQLQSCIDAAIESLGLMYEALSNICNDLKGKITEERSRD